MTAVTEAPAAARPSAAPAAPAAPAAAHSRDTADAARIAPITRAEARALAEAELQCFLALVETLGPEDWSQPTACTLWNVQQMLAHQAGAYAGYASWREFFRQFSQRPGPGQQIVDATNACQVADRAGRTPAELIAELRAVGPKAIAARQRVPRLLRQIGVPDPIAGVLRVGHLLDEIYTRDTWMHRLDIVRATGRSMALSAEHDGRIVALIVRDLAHMLAPKLGGKSILLVLAGPAGGTWRLGADPTPTATNRMDALDFNIYASGRFDYAEARARAVVEGDAALGEAALKEFKVLY
jgi:uncharacterized protein (TIGR03083 family)